MLGHEVGQEPLDFCTMTKLMSRRSSGWDVSGGGWGWVVGIGSGSGGFAQLERVMRLCELRFAFSVRSLGVAAKFLRAR